MAHAGAARRRRRGADPGPRLPAVDGGGLASRGGTPVHYLCDEHVGLACRTSPTSSARSPTAPAPSSSSTRTTRPAPCTRRDVLTRIVELARRHNLIIFSDEIYDRILYDGAEHIPIASARARPAVPDLQRAVEELPGRRVPLRAGWCCPGPKQHAESYIEGLDILANMRLCPNVPGQHAIQAALGGHQSIDDLVLPGGRLREQRDRRMEAAERDPGRELRQARRARCTSSPASTPRSTRSRTTSASSWTCCEQQKLLVVQGTGFNWPNPTTSASSPSSTPTTSKRPSAASASSSTPTAAESVG